MAITFYFNAAVKSVTFLGQTITTSGSTIDTSSVVSGTQYTGTIEFLPGILSECNFSYTPTSNAGKDGALLGGFKSFTCQAGTRGINGTLSINATVIEIHTPKETFIKDMDDLAKSIVDKAGSSGKKTIKEMKSLVDGIELGEVLPEWDGAYEEIVSGYTLTLSSTVEMLNVSTYTYSIDDGATWNQFTSSTLTLQDVSKIKFKNESVTYGVRIGSAPSGSDIGFVIIGATSDNYTVSSDTTFYLSLQTGGGSDD